MGEFPSKTKSNPISCRFLNAKEVADRLGCSWRHVVRMADQGLMPWGLKLGTLRRWDMEVLEKWIEDGCKPVKKKGKAK